MPNHTVRVEQLGDGGAFLNVIDGTHQMLSVSPMRVRGVGVWSVAPNPETHPDEPVSVLALGPRTECRTFALFSFACLEDLNTWREVMGRRWPVQYVITPAGLQELGTVAP